MTVHKNATIGEGCQIADTAIVSANVQLGDNCIVDDYCILGYPTQSEEHQTPLVIGASSHVRSHSTLYQGSSYGPGLKVGHNSMLREGIEAGVSFQVGSFNDLEGLAKIGDYVRFHSNVHMGRGTTIKDFVWVFPYVVFTNDPIPPSGLMEGATIEAGAVVATSAVVLPNTWVGEGVFIGAMTRAQGAIPTGALYVGNPGKIVGSVRKLRHTDTNKQHPWMSHFAWAYPNAAQPAIAALRERIERGCDVLEQDTR